MDIDCEIMMPVQNRGRGEALHVDEATVPVSHSPRHMPFGCHGGVSVPPMKALAHELGRRIT